MELLAQLRPSGRILDHFRITLDGSAAISQELDLGQLIPSSTFKGHKLAFQFWPQDFQIRRNMMTSMWMDVPALVAPTKCRSWTPLELAYQPAADPESCSLRWAVIVGKDGGMHLQLQSLPCDAVSLSGKPATNG